MNSSVKLMRKLAEGLRKDLENADLQVLKHKQTLLMYTKQSNSIRRQLREVERSLAIIDPPAKAE